jgi:MFS transporter, DHA3 family, macrolide efflux protein
MGARCGHVAAPFLDDVLPNLAASCAILTKPPLTEVYTNMASPASTLGFGDVLKTPAVKRLWIAQLVSVFGDFLAIFAVISVVTFQLHGTPTQVGLILVAFLTPLAVVSPLAGVFVDKWNVKWTLIASDAVRGCLVVALLFVRDLYAIYAIFFLLASVSAFFMPAQSVAIRTLAPPGGLMSANALMQQAAQVSMIVAPSVAGVLVEGLGANVCFGFDVLSFFVSAGLVLTLTIKREGPPAPASSVLSSLMQGFRFIFSHAAISFVMIAMASGMFAFRAFGALLSIYVRDILKMQSRTFGILNSLIGFGMIAGTQLVRRFSARSTPQHMVIYGLAGIGIAVFVTALFGLLGTTAAGMLALGFFFSFIIIPSQTLLQQETPPEMLGRVMSSLMSLLAAAQVVAMVIAGPTAEVAGIRNLYFGSAVMLVGIGVIGFWKLRAPAQSAAPLNR